MTTSRISRKIKHELDMEDKHQVGKLWDPNDTQSRPLRRPNASVTSTNISENAPLNVQPSPQTVDISHSKLSVHAEEWYPKNYYSSAPPSSVQSLSSVQERLQKIKLSSSTGHNEAEGIEAASIDERDSVYTTKLREIVSSLTYDPGRFDDLVLDFMNILQPYADNILVCNDVAEMLFNTVSNIYLHGFKICLNFTLVDLFQFRWFWSYTRNL